MQFKNPDILYALALLLIPIVVHLFQLRRFKKTPFSNVRFLKAVIAQTRNSSQLKKWLVLLTRILGLGCLIIAFAQPFFGSIEDLSFKKDFVVYIDNSFSMEAKGANGSLFKRAINDLVSNFNTTDNITLFTNSSTYKNKKLNSITNELLSHNYSPNKLPLETVLLKAQSLFRTSDSLQQTLLVISDFQTLNSVPLPDFSEFPFKIELLKLLPKNKTNFSIDSVYINPEGQTTELVAKFSGTNVTAPLSVSLLKDSTLIAKQTLTIGNNNTIKFPIQNSAGFNGLLKIEDPNGLQYDNTLFFNNNTPQRIKVLEIHNNTSAYLNRIYTDAECVFNRQNIQQLNYNSIDSQQLIILNELQSIPDNLQAALLRFTSNGGYIVVIPAQNANTLSYNEFLKKSGFSTINSQPSVKLITQINYDHPLYKTGVFYEKETKFQYPKANSIFKFNNLNSPVILGYEDGSPFLTSKNNVYVFTASLEAKTSNFKQSQLIVPTFDRIAKLALQTPALYYNIGDLNVFDISVPPANYEVVTLSNSEEVFIPQQRQQTEKIQITTSDLPTQTGHFDIYNKTASFGNVSFNYNRNESVLNYYDISDADAALNFSTVQDYFQSLKSKSEIDALWKWFVIFALAFFILEMLLVKYFK